MNGTLPTPYPGYTWVWLPFEQRYAQVPVAQTLRGYARWDAELTQKLYTRPTVRRAVTRPPFPHGKHIRWSAATLGVWLVTGYPLAYVWHRFGPTKSVTTWSG